MVLRTASHRNSPTHFLAQAGQAPPLATNLEPLHAELLFLQLPSRCTDLLLQTPLLLRVEDRAAAGRAGPPPPFSPSLLRGTRGGFLGLQGCGEHGRGGGGEGAAEALTQQQWGRGWRGRGLPRPGFCGGLALTEWGGLWLGGGRTLEWASRGETELWGA